MKRFTWGLVAIVGMLAFALVAAGPASAKDRNNDRIPDRWEKSHNLSLKVNQAKRDQDSDGLNNRGEYRSNSDPRDDDSDDDGTEDGDENAGTVASFDGTTLTINLLNGSTISGLVTEDTEVKCGNECDRDGEESEEETAERHPGNSGPGSESSGPGGFPGHGGYPGAEWRGIRERLLRRGPRRGRRDSRGRAQAGGRRGRLHRDRARPRGRGRGLPPRSSGFR